jgi:pSer/pThr/pTyr-binding forkhead associated (FHA) protein
MVQFEILTGKQAGAKLVARRFPVRIGRGPRADVRLEEPGVFEDHLRLEIVPREGFRLVNHSAGNTSVNGQPVAEAWIRNGDLIELGGLKLRFWLAEPDRSGMSLREALTWLGVIAVTLGQIAMIYWLLSV